MTVEFDQFASFHVHPKSLDTGSTVKSFADKEVELGSGCLTCTDHGTVEAVNEVYELAQKKGLIAIPGLECYFRDDYSPILQKMGITRTDKVPHGNNKEKWRQDHPDGTYYEYIKYMHLTCHFQDYEAYTTAVKLLSKADLRAEKHGSERKPMFDMNDIEELASKNVTMGTSCLIGGVSRFLIGPNSVEGAKKHFEWLHHLFKDRLYAEIFPHVCDSYWAQGIYMDVVDENGVAEKLRFHENKRLRTILKEDEGITAGELAAVFNARIHTHLLQVKNRTKWVDFEKNYKILKVEKIEGFLQNECIPNFAPDGDLQYGCNRFILEMAEKYGVKCLVSSDAHYANPDDKTSQDVRLAQSGSWKFANTYHLMSSQEAWPYFRDKLSIPETQYRQWIDNSREWRDSFKDFKFKKLDTLPRRFYPKDTLQNLKTLIQKHGRMSNDPVYLARLKKEINLLHKNGKVDILPYFFLLEDICSFYVRQGRLRGEGRGSAAGLYLNYLLGITHLDPIEHGLTTERFITDTRILSGKMPDIDQDLPSRDLLEGGKADVVEVLMEDGTKHILPETLKIETKQGVMSVLEAVEKQADILPWWQDQVR